MHATSTETPGCDRRAFLAAAGAGLFGGLALPAGVHAAATVEAIDCHTHFYDPTRPKGVPWPGPQDKVLYRRVLPDEFKELTRKHHVGGTIVVEASPWVEDNQWLLDLAARDPFLVGVVGRLDPASTDFPKLLERFAKDPLFRGIRVAHAEVKKGLDETAFLRNLRLLAEHDRELDVNGGPDMPADVARLAKAVPELRLVINHAANVRIDGQAAPADWLRGLRAAAAHKHVYCKVSALVEGTGRQQRDAPTDAGFYRPVLDALWDTFGEDRLIYGSNWPVSERAASYATLYSIAESYFRTKGQAPLEKFLRRNAVAAYKPIERRPVQDKR